MAVIRCSLAKDGKLIPSVVEFEPGDAIQFKSDRPVHVLGQSSTEIVVPHSFKLNDVSGHSEDAGLHLDLGSWPDPRVPGPHPHGVPPWIIYVDGSTGEDVHHAESAGHG